LITIQVSILSNFCYLTSKSLIQVNRKSRINSLNSEKEKIRLSRKVFSVDTGSKSRYQKKFTKLPKISRYQTPHHTKFSNHRNPYSRVNLAQQWLPRHKSTTPMINRANQQNGPTVYYSPQKKKVFRKLILKTARN